MSGPVHISAALRELLKARGLDRLLAPPTAEERQHHFDWSKDAQEKSLPQRRQGRQKTPSR